MDKNHKQYRTHWFSAYSYWFLSYISETGTLIRQNSVQKYKKSVCLKLVNVFERILDIDVDMRTTDVPSLSRLLRKKKQLVPDVVR